MEDVEDDRGSEEAPRSLDNALKASIDMVALNNKVVCMRGTVKKAKIYTIRKLKRRARQLELRQKFEKGTAEERVKGKRRLKRFLQEIHVIRHLKADLVAKYALGCTETVDELCKKENDVAIEIRALTRLSEHKLMQMSIERFREEHEDWKSLAAFLLTKQSGRRIKKQQGQTPVEKMITNVRTGQLMVKSYLQDKLQKNVELPQDKKSLKKKTTSVDKGVDDDDDDDSDNSVDEKSIVSGDEVKETKSPASSASEADCSRHTKQISSGTSSRKRKTDSCKIPATKKLDNSSPKKRKTDSSQIEVIDFKSKESDSAEHFTSVRENKINRKMIQQLKGFNDDDEEEDGDEDDDNSDSEINDHGSDEESVCDNPDSDDGSGENVKPYSKFVEKSSGEMVVKKINLDEDMDDDFICNKNVKIFDDNMTLTKKSKSKKASDSFFVTSDQEEDELETGSDGGDASSDVDSDEVDDDTNEEIGNEIGNQSSKGKSAIRSTFMYSLADSKRSSGHHGVKGRTKTGTGKSEGWVRGRGGTRGGVRGVYGKRGKDSRGSFSGNKGRGNFDRSIAKGNFDGKRGRGGFNKMGAQSNRRGQEFGIGGQNWKSDKQSFGNKGKQNQFTMESVSINPQQPLQKAGSSKADDEGPLHPSWQASKKRKEQGTIKQFQGTKIKFDDD